MKSPIIASGSDVAGAAHGANVQSSQATKAPNTMSLKRKADDDCDYIDKSEETQDEADVDVPDVDEAEVVDETDIDHADLEMGNDDSEYETEVGVEAGSESESESGSEEESGRSQAGFVESEDEEAEELAALSSPLKNGARLTSNVSTDIVGLRLFNHTIHRVWSVSRSVWMKMTATMLLRDCRRRLLRNPRSRLLPNRSPRRLRSESQRPQLQRCVPLRPTAMSSVLSSALSLIMFALMFPTLSYTFSGFARAA